MADKFDLAFIENFLTLEEREHFAHMIDTYATHLETPLDLQWPKPPRRCDLSALGMKEVYRLEERLAWAFRVPRAFGEGLQGQVYEDGQNYAPHRDAFDNGTPEFDRQMPRAGQRSYSALIYVEVPSIGGVTTFPRLGVTIHPSPGTAIFWSNLDDDHRPHVLSLHSSMPVLGGRKIVITSWYRERTYER